jgi:hypothetical protein
MSPAAICERPALWTQTNSTSGTSVTDPDLAEGIDRRQYLFTG